MSDTQKIGVFIDWHIPSRSTTGPDFAPVDHWAERLHEVCDAAIEAALKTGAAHIEIKVLSRELQLSRQFLKGERIMRNELLAREIADRIAKDVAELPDRTSPDDWPEAMLVTAEELIMICERNIDLALNRETGTQTETSAKSMRIETKDDFNRLLEALCMELPISDEQMFGLIVAHGECVRAAVDEEREACRLIAQNREENFDIALAIGARGIPV